MEHDQRPSKPTSNRADTLFRGARILVPAYCVLLATFALPPAPLDGGLALAAYGLSESGGWVGMPLLVVFMTLVLVTRPAIAMRRRLSEAAAIIATVIALLAGGSQANEYVLKPALAVPRPNIVSLVEAGVIPTSAEEFYEQGDKGVRSAKLGALLEESEAEPAMHEVVRQHWIAETGYSMPSGHSFAAMFFAAFFCLLGILLLGESKRRWLAYLVVPWAVAVCYSRAILRVHSATDVSLGGLQGICLGLLGFLIVHRLIGRNLGKDES